MHTFAISNKLDLRVTYASIFKRIKFVSLHSFARVMTALLRETARWVQTIVVIRELHKAAQMNTPGCKGKRGGCDGS